MIREDFLQQNAFVEVDSFSNYDRQSRLLAMILDYDRLCRGALEKGADPDALFSLPARAAIGRAKSVPEERYIQPMKPLPGICPADCPADRERRGGYMIKEYRTIAEIAGPLMVGPAGGARDLR